MRPGRSVHVSRPTLRLIQPFVAASVLLLLTVPPPPAYASFHLIEINKILTAYNGDATIQAVELRMVAGGQNLVSGLSIRSYDAAGILLATHGAFASSLPVGAALADRKILCATSGFATTFGITPDLVISAGLPLATGQVSFETVTCFVNAVGYGDVTLPKNGTTSAPAIPSGLAYVLTRTVNNATLFSCPLAEDAAARFAVRSGSSGAPVPFSNNAGTTVNVLSIVTGADGGVLPGTWRIYPNPFQGAVRIETPRWERVAVYNVRGGLVATLATGMERAVGPQRLQWNGQDARGRRAPDGVYFIGYGEGTGRSLRRVVLLR